MGVAILNVNKYIQLFIQMSTHYLDGNIVVYDGCVIFKSRKYKWVCKFPKENIDSAYASGVSIEHLCDIYIDYIIKEWSKIITVHS